VSRREDEAVKIISAFVIAFALMTTLIVATAYSGHRLD
jgi:hypothetical protein